MHHRKSAETPAPDTPDGRLAAEVTPVPAFLPHSSTSDVFICPVRDIWAFSPYHAALRTGIRLMKALLSPRISALRPPTPTEEETTNLPILKSAAIPLCEPSPE
jgi:hypothetical protein